jgi:hypothetical protein
MLRMNTSARKAIAIQFAIQIFSLRSFVVDCDGAADYSARFPLSVP